MDGPGWDDCLWGEGGNGKCSVQPEPGAVLQEPEPEPGPARTSVGNGRERWCSQMALILGVPTVELELAGYYAGTVPRKERWGATSAPNGPTD